MDVPFHSQQDVVDIEQGIPSPQHGTAWSDRACAIACITMVLNHYGRRTSMVEVLSAALERQAYNPIRGWLHGGLVEVLQSFGLIAYRRNWRLLDGRESAYLAGRAATTIACREIELVKNEMLDEGVRTVCRLLAARIPVIVSIYRPWRDLSSVGHQVVLVGADDDRVTFHDPAQRSGAFTRRGRRDFFENWKGTAIVAREGPPLSPSRG